MGEAKRAIEIGREHQRGCEGEGGDGVLVRSEGASLGCLGIDREEAEASVKRRREKRQDSNVDGDDDERDRVGSKEVCDLDGFEPLVLSVSQEVPGEAGHQMRAEVFEGCPDEGSGNNERNTETMDADASESNKEGEVESAVNGERSPGDVHAGVTETHPLKGRDEESHPAEEGCGVHAARWMRDADEHEKRNQSDPGEEAKVQGEEAGVQNAAGGH